MKLFLRYVNDIVRTVRGEPSCLLDAASSPHPNLQFTLEETNLEGNLPLLDLNINLSQGRGVTCSCYQKPTDKGTILNYRSGASTQYKFLGVHPAGSNMIRLWKLIGRNG